MMYFWYLRQELTRWVVLCYNGKFYPFYYNFYNFYNKLLKFMTIATYTSHQEVYSMCCQLLAIAFATFRISDNFLHASNVMQDKKNVLHTVLPSVYLSFGLHNLKIMCAMNGGDNIHKRRKTLTLSRSVYHVIKCTYRLCFQHLCQINIETLFIII